MHVYDNTVPDTGIQPVSGKHVSQDQNQSMDHIARTYDHCGHRGLALHFYKIHRIKERFKI